MLDYDIKNKLIHVRNWAQEKIDGGTEPRWSWYQYMKLIESVDAIVCRNDVMNSIDHVRGAVPYHERRLRLVKSSDSPEPSRL